MYIQNYNQNSKLFIEKGIKPFAFLIEHEDDSFYVTIFFTEKSDLKQLINAAKCNTHIIANVTRNKDDIKHIETVKVEKGFIYAL